MNDLKISLVQTKLIWQEPEANCQHISNMIEQSGCDTDLIILPEMFNSGFTLDAKKVAESMDGPTVSWMQELAKSSNAAVTGSLVINTDNKNYNRMVFATPDGALSFYDKKHLFRMADEHQRYAAGDSKVTVNWRGWRIGLFVCYDLRFPVWCRSRDNVDLMLFVASWPAVRTYPWQTLLKARAMENLCYVCGVNRVGVDANDINYCGDSGVLDMAGMDLLQLSDHDTVETTSLSATKLQKFRTIFPAHLDADEFDIK